MSGSLWAYVSAVFLAILVAVAANGFSTQYRGHTQHPTLPEHCLYEELQLAVPLHGFILPNGYDDYCVRVECTEDYLLIIRHCDKQSFPRPGCHLSESKFELSYPACCPQLECEKENLD
ncbi:uncharacterized protein LOC110181549 [Drosophila serrata]|uniref:uncharacterized protein LOC110181549 n=1 Tax=Drosophila serrata TaxID=7274 RepID=UPI000A1D317D|nr:uncharacterized protein LOC110181549 [Drosophila serrata]